MYGPGRFLPECAWSEMACLAGELARQLIPDGMGELVSHIVFVYLGGLEFMVWNRYQLSLWFGRCLVEGQCDARNRLLVRVFCVVGRPKSESSWGPPSVIREAKRRE